jgi:hypothetical protein
MNNQNLIIGVLTVTATILLVGLLLMGTISQQEAKGFAQHDRGGDYVMLTSQWRNEMEILWIIDARAETMGMYWFEPKRGRLELIDVVALSPGQR